MKRVIVVASGPTEQAALPKLLSGLLADGIELVAPVRIPPGHRDIRGASVAQVVKAAWFATFPRPDKFVVLKDADGADAAEVAERLEREIDATGVRKTVDAPVLVAVAKWHLEAWYFADPASLRNYLGRDLGSVDATDPDAIENPKHHLQQLLKARLDVYTAEVAAEIAAQLSPSECRRSRSFVGFENAVRNGDSSRPR
ncbi:MAG: DUF4276 family protein [Polyangiaceae bacterium]